MLKNRHMTIHSTDTNSNLNKQKISCVNSAATNTEMKNFAQGVIGLTTDTYVDSEIAESYSLNLAIEEEEDNG